MPNSYSSAGTEAQQRTKSRKYIRRPAILPNRLLYAVLFVTVQIKH